MKTGFKRLMVLLPLIFFLTFFSSAQETGEPFPDRPSYSTSDEPVGPPGGGDLCEVDCPIDSWLASLLFVGALYGMYKNGHKEIVVKRN